MINDPVDVRIFVSKLSGLIGGARAPLDPPPNQQLSENFICVANVDFTFLEGISNLLWHELKCSIFTAYNMGVPLVEKREAFFLILVHDELHETNYKLVRNFILGNFVCEKQSVLLSTWCMGNSWGSCHLSSTYTLSVLAPVWISPLFLCHLGYSERLRSWHGFYHMLFMWRKYMCSAMVKMGTLE